VAALRLLQAAFRFQVPFQLLQASFHLLLQVAFLLQAPFHRLQASQASNQDRRSLCLRLPQPLHLRQVHWYCLRVRNC